MCFFRSLVDDFLFKLFVNSLILQMDDGRSSVITKSLLLSKSIKGDIYEVVILILDSFSPLGSL